MLEVANKESLKGILSNRNSLLRALYFPDLAELQSAVECLKNLGVIVAMTSGVYDGLHDGHVEYLRQARGLGDILVLAVDTDKLVVERKGPGRPIAGLAERLSVLADLRCVDILTLCDINPDPAYVVKAVRPDVLVTSKTTKEMTPEVITELRRYCGQVELLDPQSSNTTTARIMELMRTGALGELRSVRGILDGMIGRLENKEGGEKDG